MGGGGARRRRPALAVGRRARPTRSRATFARRASAARRRSGCTRAGASPCGALDLAGNVCEWTAGGGVRGGSYLHGPDELRCSRRLPMHPAARDHYVGFRVVASSPRRRLRLGRACPRGEYAIGRDRAASRGDELVAGRLRVRALAHARHERAVRARSSPTRGAGSPPHWPAPATTIRSRSSTGSRRRPSARGPAAACRPRPSGRRRRAAPTRARYPWGDDEDATPRARRRRPEARRRPRRSARIPTARARTVCWTWPATSGSGSGDAHRRPGRRPERVLRGGSFASPGLAWARCAMRSHSRPERRQAHIGFRVARGAHMTVDAEAPARPDARARRGREPDRRHGRRRRGSTRAGSRRSGMEVELLDDVFPATPTVVGAAARRPARADGRAQRAPRHGPDPARPAAHRGRLGSTGAARPT